MMGILSVICMVGSGWLVVVWMWFFIIVLLIWLVRVSGLTCMAIMLVVMRLSRVIRLVVWFICCGCWARVMFMVI